MVKSRVCKQSAKVFKSSALGRMFHSLKPKCSLRELTICSSKQCLQHRTVRIGLQTVLKTCTSLRILKFYNPVSTSIVRGLAAGLMRNKTLHTLEINKKGLNMSNIAPIFASLQLCAVTRLEFIDEFVFQREPDSTHWKIESLLWPNKVYKKLCEMYRVANINIDSIIDKNTEEMELWFPTVNIEIAKILLRSFGSGDFPIRELTLNSIVDGSDSGIGPDIEEMLKSKSLKKIKVNVFTTLAENLLVQRILKTDFTNSSVSFLQIGNGILLQRSERVEYDTDKTGELVEHCEIISPWKVTTVNNNILSCFFVLLSQTHMNYPTHSTLCHLVLQSLKQLDLRYAHLNYDQLVTLLKILQHDTNVANLDISSCVLNSSMGLDSDLHCALHELLMKSTTLNRLDITGIMNIKIAVTIATWLTNYSSLKSLSMDMNIKVFGFDILEQLLYSFVHSNLRQLEFTGVCLLHKDHSSWYINLSNNHLQSSWQGNLLQCWIILFMLITISRQIQSWKLSLGTRVSDDLQIKVFRSFFGSVIQRYHYGDTISCGKNAAVNVIQALKELYLEYTVQGRTLVTTILESLQISTSLTKLYFSHEEEYYSLDELLLGSTFEKLLLSNSSLKVISFIREVSNEVANGVAAGLKQNTTLQTLQLSVNLLTISTLACLLESLHTSGLTCLHITNGCVIHKIRDSSYAVEFTGDKLLLGQLFCASVQARNCCKGLQEALSPNKKLTLSGDFNNSCLLYTSPSPRDATLSRMPSSA